MQTGASSKQTAFDALAGTAMHGSQTTSRSPTNSLRGNWKTAVKMPHACVTACVSIFWV